MGTANDRTGRAAGGHSTAQHSTAQHSTAQHSTAQHSVCSHHALSGRPPRWQIVERAVSRRTGDVGGKRECARENGQPRRVGSPGRSKKDLSFARPESMLVRMPPGTFIAPPSPAGVGSACRRSKVLVYSTRMLSASACRCGLVHTGGGELIDPPWYLANRPKQQNNSTTTKGGVNPNQTARKRALGRWGGRGKRACPAPMSRTVRAHAVERERRGMRTDGGQ